MSLELTIQSNRKHINKNTTWNDFKSRFIPWLDGYPWLEKYFDSYKEHPEIEYFAKPLYFADRHQWCDLFESYVVAFDNPNPAEYLFMWTTRIEDDDEKQVFGDNVGEWGKRANGKQDMYHIYIKPRKEVMQFIQSCRADDRDSMSIEIIDWSNKYLIVSSSSIIISSRWLALVDKPLKFNK